MLRRLPAAAASGRAGGAQIWAARARLGPSQPLYPHPPFSLLPPLPAAAGGCRWVVHARGDPDGCCDAVPRQIPAAEAAGRRGGGAVQVIFVACWTRSRWWPACWRCAGRCPNLRLPTFLGFPLHVLPSSPTFFVMSGLHLHLRSLLMGRGEIPAQQRPVLSTATPEGAVTSLEALA
ncbi:hypothetical protein D1007_34398 [Hordeum vulgare]|nr:hypothetical protein D1007_34398 [Hordeum vulgare]